jgi:hypothetical protein
VVYRPITEPATWAAGAKAEAYADGVLDMVEGEPINGLLASNGGVSPFLVALMEEGGMTKVPSGGAGKSKSKSKMKGFVFFSTLLASYFMWSAALDSSYVLLSYFIASLASHIIIILINSILYHSTYRR